MSPLSAALAWFFEGDWYNSPFIVPVAGCAMIGSIAVAGIWSGVRTREIRSQERLARIAQGLPVEPEFDETLLRAVTSAPASAAAATVRRPTDGSGARRAGVVLVSVALGLILFFVALAIIVRTPEVLSGAAAGLIPLVIGLGFLIDARSKRRDYERYLDWERQAPAATPVYPGATAPPPPPPTASDPLSPAQASDWRPLH